MKKVISLHTHNTTYQIGVADQGYLLHLYYGPKADTDMDFLLTYYDRGFSMNTYDAGDDRTVSLDSLPQEYPTYGTGDFRTPAFDVRDAHGTFGCDLRYVSDEREEGLFSIPGLPAVYADQEEAYTQKVVICDRHVGVEVTLLYGVLPALDVITRAAVIRNVGEGPISLEKVCSASLDFVAGDFDLLHFHGRHGMERNLERTPVSHGDLKIGSRRGMSSHQHSPFVILAERSCNEDHGACYGMSLLYSGNFGCEVEKDQISQTRLTMGVNSDMFSWFLRPGEEFHTPEVALAYSDQGLAHLSHLYHRVIRYHVCRGKWRDIRRPVLINNWEATYFDFTGEKILGIARQARELGVEMMVLDDGWFGARNSDHAGLGDWVVNEKKLGGTLGDLVKQINAMGMKFGLWIEPEMVNEDSDLYRAHPDWAFEIPGRSPVRGRGQLVLDFSREEIVDAIFGMLAKVIDSANVEYIKMDMNRGLSDIYTINTQVEGLGAENAGAIMHRYMLGVYAFLEKLRTRYPDLLIEGCAGGGGRFDAGMLYYTPQIWCSDNTDAVERIRIQHGSSFGFPISAVGSHVSASPNEQTGRSTPIHTRAVVAMAGSFGYELDLNKVSDIEKEEVRMQIQDYKKYWNLIHNGDYYRLHTPGVDTEAAAWCFTARDRSECLLNVVTLDTHCNSPVSYVRCKGLDPQGHYFLDGTDRDVPYSGAALMSVGFPIPNVPGEYNAWQLHLVRG